MARLRAKEPLLWLEKTRTSITFPILFWFLLLSILAWCGYTGFEILEKNYGGDDYLYLSFFLSVPIQIVLGATTIAYQCRTLILDRQERLTDLLLSTPIEMKQLLRCRLIGEWRRMGSLFILTCFPTVSFFFLHLFIRDGAATVFPTFKDLLPIAILLLIPIFFAQRAMKVPTKVFLSLGFLLSFYVGLFLYANSTNQNRSIDYSWFLLETIEDPLWFTALILLSIWFGLRNGKVIAAIMKCAGVIVIFYLGLLIVFWVVAEMGTSSRISFTVIYPVAKIATELLLIFILLKKIPKRWRTLNAESNL
jgi:hypothetical protein